MKINTETKQKKIQIRLMTLRQEAEMSQDALAQKAGIERKTVNRIENGHFSPNLDTLLRLCQALRVKPEELLKGL
jgi:hypothetical protein